MSGFTLNHVVISGNLTRDPELRSLPSGVSVCELGIAVNERIKVNDQWTDRANFFDVTVWGGLGEWVARNLGKGAGIAVAGRLRYESWEKDGQKRSKVKIVADSIMPRGDNQGGGSNNGFAARSDVPADSAYAGAGAAPTGAYGGGTTAPADDDIPF